MISCSRNIRLYFTGNLATGFKTNSQFSVNERHLLRAQIARISASTHISPTDFYQLDDDGKLIENPDYEPSFPLDESEISLDDWVHHTEFILSQGNTGYRNVYYYQIYIQVMNLPFRLAEKLSKPDSAAEGDENLENDEEEDESEAAPPLLRPISEDDDLDDGTSAWSAHLCTGGLRAASLLIASNYWPGAFTIASNKYDIQSYMADKRWWNVYIGWGQKCKPRDEKRYQVLPHSVADEFEDPYGELQEAVDPTPEEEEEWKTAHAEMRGEDAETSANEGETEEESEELESSEEENE
ncbi:unnamed protein product [Hymenolepis diminuta]|uniref:TYR_PHOSPHATASE_2 domain-containing protein n=1 Tax=Hymenolepis diminuta TaxID=6216 RepID=A0A0R3SJ65_HYMDI|nr:unnamed protein product [Hymenolepis diminuta]